jgi:tetratricopeptide (TPR) repeat protein
VAVRTRRVRTPGGVLRMALAAASPAAPFLAAAGILGVWLGLVPASGGYFERDWAPAALALLGLLVAVVLGGGRLLPAQRPATVALVLLGGLVALNFLSLLWAGSPGSAWVASNKLLMYLVVAWLVTLLPWTARSATRLLAVWSLGIAALCAASVLSALGASDVGGLFVESRYAGPLGYSNGMAAMAAMAALPLLALSSGPRVHPLAAGAGVATAAFLAEFALLPESRAAVLGLLVALIALLALIPHRVALATRAAVVAGAVIVAGPALLDVNAAVGEQRPVIPELRAAAEMIGVTTAAAGLVAVLVALLEARIAVGPRARQWVRRAAAGIVVAVLLGGAGIAAANSGRIGDQLERQWHEFRSGAASTASGSRLFTTEPFQRYDYWRVALRTFLDAPVAGVGAGNFERHYTSERRFAKHSRYAHSIWFRAIAENGAVGAALVAALLACVLAGVVLAWRGGTPSERSVVAASLAVAGYFLFHASLDWLDEFPVLAGPAVGLPFMVLTLTTPRGRTRAVSQRGRRAGMAVFVAATVAAGASLVLPYASLRYVERARSASSDRATAYRDLDRAAALDPISIDPALTEGIIALHAADPRRARAAFRKALEIEEHWLPHFELALLDASEGRFGAARRALDRAQRLNAMDPLVQTARERANRRERIDPVALNRSILEDPLFERRRLE